MIRYLLLSLSAVTFLFVCFRASGIKNFSLSSLKSRKPSHSSMRRLDVVSPNATSSTCLPELFCKYSTSGKIIPVAGHNHHGIKTRSQPNRVYRKPDVPIRLFASACKNLQIFFSCFNSQDCTELQKTAVLLSIRFSLRMRWNESIFSRQAPRRQYCQN